MLAFIVFFLGIRFLKIYSRSILRRRAEKLELFPSKLLPAQNKVILRNMVQVTFLTPLKILFIEPIIALTSLYVVCNFAVLFQWFIAVPIVLHLVYDFTVQQAGLAFIAAIVGSVLAATTLISINIITYFCFAKNNPETVVYIKYGLLLAMINSLFITASLF